MARRFTRKPGRRTGWSRRPATPSRSTARAIVRKAGPLETSFFLDSTLTTYGSTPASVYATAANIHSQQIHQLFGPNDYDFGGAARDKVRINRALCIINSFTPYNYTDGNHPFQSSHQFALLVAAEQALIDTWFDAGVNDANPFGAQTSVSQYEQLARGTRVLARKYWMRQHRLDPETVIPGEDVSAIELALASGRPSSYIKSIGAKGFWLREPESLWLVTGSIVLKSISQPENEIGGWSGYHTTQISFARY